MPFGPGTYGAQGGGGLAAPAQQRQGIPQPGVGPSMEADDQAIAEIIQQLRRGQVGSERFLQLLSLLAGSALPGMDQQGGQAPQRGQGVPTGPGGPAGPGPDIMSLLGG